MTPSESPNTLAIDILQTAPAPLFEIATVQPRPICNSPHSLVASADRNTPVRAQPDMRARASRWVDWDTDISKWLFRGVNTCLAGAAIFIAYQIWGMLREAPAASMPDPAPFAALADRAGTPPSMTRLTDYQVVWNRNLFDSTRFRWPHRCRTSR